MITEQQRVSLKKLFISQEWKAFEVLIEELCKEVQNRPKTADSEWETLKNTIGDEAEVRGIRRVYQQVFNEANKVK